MKKTNLFFAAVTVILATTAATSFAMAAADCPHAKTAAEQSASSAIEVATLDNPVESVTVRKIDLQAEPIQQSEGASEPESQIEGPPEGQSETQPTDQSDAVPETPDTTGGAPAATSEITADAAEPKTAKRICRKFSAAIAMVIEVPCE